MLGERGRAEATLSTHAGHRKPTVHIPPPMFVGVPVSRGPDPTCPLLLTFCPLSL